MEGHAEEHVVEGVVGAVVGDAGPAFAEEIRGDDGGLVAGGEVVDLGELIADGLGVGVEHVVDVLEVAGFALVQDEHVEGADGAFEGVIVFVAELQVLPFVQG